jgi:hypothetical protein
MKSVVIYQAFPNGTPKFNITALNIVEIFVIMSNQMAQLKY